MDHHRLRPGPLARRSGVRPRPHQQAGVRRHLRRPRRPAVQGLRVDPVRHPAALLGGARSGPRGRRARRAGGRADPVGSPGRAGHDHVADPDAGRDQGPLAHDRHAARGLGAQLRDVGPRRALRHRLRRRGRPPRDPARQGHRVAARPGAGRPARLRHDRHPLPARGAQLPADPADPVDRRRAAHQRRAAAGPPRGPRPRRRRGRVDQPAHRPPRRLRHRPAHRARVRRDGRPHQPDRRDRPGHRRGGRLLPRRPTRG